MDPVEEGTEQPAPAAEHAEPASATEDAAVAGEQAAPGEAGGEEPVATSASETTAPPGDGGLGVAPPVLVGGGVVAALALGLVVWGATRRRPELPPPPVPIAETPAKPGPDVAEEPEAPSTLVNRLRASLGKSRAALQGRFDHLFGRGELDDALFDELEEALLTADVGLPTTERLLQPLRDLAGQGDIEPPELREALRTAITAILGAFDPSLRAPGGDDPLVILVVGVNGSGKTTTIGKLAARYVASGHKVMLAAGDTYRAAAAEQLQIWAERAGADIVAHQPGADPGAVVYSALEAAKARGHDVVIVDTAGRLQTRAPLMEQLAKIRRVIGKIVPDGPHETLLVLDGTMGQNGLSQARLFNEATPLTGVAVTKLDGTAKGGMILTLAAEVGLPIKLVGIGEKIDDLKEFDAHAFAAVLA